MARYNIFVDSNIFTKYMYHFTGGTLANLKKLCDAGAVTLYSSDIVISETKRHIHEDVNIKARQAANAIKKDPEIFHAIGAEYSNIKKTIREVPDRLIDAFKVFMEGATILPYGNLSMEKLFADYFDAVAPFENHEKKKYEFPDAVIIMSIKSYLAKELECQLYIVTDDNGWHAALADTERVHLYKDIKELLTIIAHEQETLYTQIAQYVGTQLDVLCGDIESWVCEQDWAPVVDAIDVCVECEEIDDLVVTNIEAVPSGVEYIDEKEGAAVVGFTGVARIEVKFPYIDHSAEVYDREDRAYYNTIYGHGKAELEIPVSGTVSVLISENMDMDLEKPEFEAINHAAVEVLECDFTPSSEDDDPYFDTCPDCGRPIGIHNDGGNGFCSECAPNH